MSTIPAKTQVLEDGADGLLAGADQVAADPNEVTEFVDLTAEPAAAAPAVQAKTPAAAPTPAAPAPAAKPAPAPVDDIPAEYKGKSLSDVVKMHREAASVIGRQGSELGELRSRMDRFILSDIEQRKQAKAAAAPAPAPAAPEFDESQFFAKPKDAVLALIENHPAIKRINETLGATAAEQAAQRATLATERFNAAHPDAAEIVNDPEFRQWVTASPIRRDLLLRAHSKFDFVAGDEVFGTWKALKNVKRAQSTAGEQPTAPAVPVVEAAPAAAPAADDVSAAARTLAQARASKAAAAQAATVPTGNTSAGKGTGGKKIYRRADVLKLMEDDPARYEQLADEIGQAYSEGRVR